MTILSYDLIFTNFLLLEKDSELKGSNQKINSILLII